MRCISQQNVKMAEYCVKDVVASNHIPLSKDLHVECILGPGGTFGLPPWLSDRDHQLFLISVLPFFYSNNNRLNNNN